MTDLITILQQFGVKGNRIEKITAGHIHQTYRIWGELDFILQQVNLSVFQKPDVIATNLTLAQQHLSKTHPDYLFVAPLPAKNQKVLVYDEHGGAWRLFPFVSGSTTFNELKNPSQAFHAAAEFGRLTRYLDGCAIHQFKPTIDRFHDLTWRFEQFMKAKQSTTKERWKEAEDSIAKAEHFNYLLDYYKKLVGQNQLTLRITHNDTKVNNILFDASGEKALAVIDLDTLMPGYFLYDLGDMVRTFVSPVSEEEQELNKIIVRKEFYHALVEGYLSQMRPILTEAERAALPNAGLLMTYIMALRFLTDFLNGDQYYQTHYVGQNLVRAKNQLHLLQLLTEFSL